MREYGKTYTTDVECHKMLSFQEKWKLLATTSSVLVSSHLATGFFSSSVTEIWGQVVLCGGPVGVSCTL